MNGPDAVVTGGGRGVGAAVARRIVARGGRVVIAARTQHELDATVAGIEADFGPGRVRAVACDVASAMAVESLHDATLEFLGGAVDLLVNNAGIAPRAWVHEMDEALWDQVLDVNLKGAYLCTRAFLPGMLARRRGRIVNVASISATLGTPRLSAYCASKWGLVGFTKAVAEETREAGVQVMAVLPGSVDTEMLKGSGFDPRMSADEVARLIEWVGLDAPAAMTASAVEMFG
jgi:NAD(P)-dependent dehydrogenase (short-subunit alcohol dehydrogenase family)